MHSHDHMFNFTTYANQTISILDIYFKFEQDK